MTWGGGLGLNELVYQKHCPVHGLTSFRREDDCCTRCIPKSLSKGATADPEAVKRRRAIEQHREKLDADEWFDN